MFILYLKKVIACTLLVTLLFNQGIFVSAAYAQEAPVPVEEPSASPSPEPTTTPEPITEPTTTLTPEPTLTSNTPVTPTLEPSPTATATPTITPSEISTNSAQPTLSPSPTATPTATPVATQSAQIASFADSKKVAAVTNEQWAPGEILVKFKEGTVNLQTVSGIAKAVEFAHSKNLEIREHLTSANISVLYTRNDTAIPSIIEELKKDDSVASAERNYKRSPSALSVNDTGKNELWGLDNFGQTVAGQVGVADADMDVPEAWAISEGSSNIIVAVVDTGVAWGHPDLTAAMWNGANCKDENGALLGGCIHGYDYASNDKDPNPVATDYAASHGTHIAGTIAAVKNNNKGIVGVAPGVKIMGLRTNLSDSSLIRAIDFARHNGAQVINASWGGPSYSQALREAVERFTAAGGLFIAAAGNSAKDIDTITDYPTKYPIDGIITVAATTNKDTLADFSNTGAQSVDVGAPGVDIYSTVASNGISAFYTQNFENIIAPALPTGWVSNGNWLTVTTGDPSWGTVLYPEAGGPYSSNANTSITTTSHNLSGKTDPRVSFWARCDTEYSPTFAYTDYLVVQFSSDGQTFTDMRRIDEIDLDTDSNAGNNITPPSKLLSLSISPSYATSNFTLRFKWVTNNTDNNHEGCAIDDIQIGESTYGTGDTYEHWNGTSMAAPQVAAIAALLWSTKQSLLASQVKSIILSTGDSIPALSGKTLSGKRVNAAKALAAIKGPGILGITNDPSPVKQKIWNWYADDTTTQFRFAVDQNPTWTPTGAFGDTKTASVTSGNGTYYLHVQAKANGIESDVVTVSTLLDTTGPSTPGIPVSPTVTPTETNNPVKQFSWTASTDISGVVHYIYKWVNETTQEIWTSGGTTLTSAATWLYDGIWSFFVYAEDNAGNKSAVLSQSVIVDTTGSSVTVTSPEDNSIHKALPDLAADAEDTTSGVKQVSFWLSHESFSSPNGGGSPCGGGGDGDGCNGGISTGAAMLIAVDNTAPYGATDWEEMFASPFPDGLYTLWAEVVDKAGNVTVGQTVSFTYDTVAPTAPSVFEPANAFITNNNSITIQGNKEPGSHVKIYSGNTVIAEEIVATSSAHSIQGGPPTWSITVPLQLNTVNNFTATATDLAGNESTKTTIPAITHDNMSPVITTYTISNSTISPSTSTGTKDSTDIDLAFSETTIAEIMIINSTKTVVRTQIIGGPTVNPNPWNWNGKNDASNFVPDGVYTVRVSATDSLGQTTVDTSKTITVDNDTLSLSPVGDKQGNEESQISFTISGTDEEGLALTYGMINGPTGAMLNSSTGQFTWTPTETQGPGMYMFSFTVTNGFDTKTEVITISVNEVNQAPVVTNAAVSATEDTNSEISLTGSDADVPSNTLTFGLASGPSHGTAVLSGTKVTYTPAKDYTGQDSFTYRANDGTTNSNTATVTITVQNVNDAPIAVNDIVFTSKNQTITITPSILLANDTDIDSTTLSITNIGSATHGSASSFSGNIVFTPENNFIGAGSFTYTITDGTLTATGTVSVTITPPVEEDQVVLAPIITVAPEKPEIVISDTGFDSTITIPSNVTNATLDVTNVAVTVGQTTSATISNDLTVNANTTLGTMSIEIPSGIVISAPAATWNGIINAPTILSTSTVTVPSSSGTTTTPTAVVEVGFGDVPLTFNKAVRLVVAGQGGKLAGYTRSGIFTQITTACTADTQAAGDLLTANGDCAMTVGADLVIWTKHFTKFVAYTQTTNSSSSNSGSSSSSSNSSSNASAPVCGDTKPGSAPVLLSAVSSGPNQVTLTWSKAKDPVSYYLVTYGSVSGKQEYGNPNVGGSTTTSYTVSGLSGGKTYYFKVRAGNGCTPGDFSNELSTRASGSTFSAPASGFIAGVLGASTKTNTESSQKDAKNTTDKKDIAQRADAKEKTDVLGEKDERFKMGLVEYIAIILVLLGIAVAAGYYVIKVKKRATEGGFSSMYVIIIAVIAILVGTIVMFGMIRSTSPPLSQEKPPTNGKTGTISPVPSAGTSSKDIPRGDYILEYAEGTCGSSTDCSWAGKGCGGGHGMCTDNPEKYEGQASVCTVNPEFPSNKGYTCTCIPSLNKCGWIKGN